MEKSLIRRLLSNDLKITEIELTLYLVSRYNPGEKFSGNNIFHDWDGEDAITHLTGRSYRMYVKAYKELIRLGILVESQGALLEINSIFKQKQE